MPQIPIPTDWNGTDWVCVILDWPNSETWLSLLRGFISEPARGRFWDAKTGSITDTQAIGLDIIGRNNLIGCTEILLALQGIQLAIEGLDVSNQQQVTIQTSISNNVTAVSNAIATSLASQTSLLVSSNVASAAAVSSSYAWSQAFSQTMVGVEVINNYPAQMRQVEPGTTTPPEAPEETATSITAVLDSTVPLAICERSYWLVAGAQEFFRLLYQAALWYEGTILAMAGAMADAFWGVAALSSPSARRYLMPASILLTLGHNLNALYVQDALVPGMALVNDFINDNFDQLVCGIAEAVVAVDSTEDIQTQIIAMWLGDYPSESPLLPGILKSWFNLSSLGALYYISNALDVAPSLPAGVDPSICECGD